MSTSFVEKKWSLSLNRDMTPFGAFASDDTIRFSVIPPEGIAVKSITMVIHGDGWGKKETVWHEYPLT